MARGLIDGTLPTIPADYVRYVTRGSGTGQPRWLGDVQLSLMAPDLVKAALRDLLS